MSDSTLDPKDAERPDALISRDDGRNYWNRIDADDNGMLGGFPVVSKVDLQGSRSFLAKMGIGVKNRRNMVTRALEGGAGIGRITRGLLLSIAEKVDIIEPISKFTAALEGEAGVGNVYNVGLEEWQPEEGVQYDLIWTQWCVGHLTDDQLVQYLKRCAAVLSPDGGVIVVKENLSTSGADVFDETDSSVTREDPKFLDLFKQADLRVVRMDIQRGFPKLPHGSLLPVKMYALKPQVPA